ncbi:thioredoxin domain-containing protein [bacterium]|nr:thioredoxin domain-containing protein [bacterium]
MKKTALIALGTFALFAQGALAIDQAEFNKAMDSYLAVDGNMEKIGSAFERYLQKRRTEEMKKQAQQEQNDMESQFKNPTKVDVGSSPVRGNPNAKITIVEFSDFQCPYCSRGASTMEQLLKDYPNDVKVAFKNLPLEFHDQAKPAAKAALAAKEQGKFWEMHDVLFQNQRELGKTAWEDLAKKVAGLDAAKFAADLKANDKKYDEMILADMKLAESLGVEGTPGFFVNGVQVRGARDANYFKGIIERWKKEGK